MPNPENAENLSSIYINDFNKRKFKKETKGYELIKEKGLEDCFTKIKFIDEQNCLVIMEAGSCDL